MSPLSTSAILLQLADYRTETRREPHSVTQLGQQLLQRGWASSASDELWTVLEQVATAAVECGQLSLADVCASRLATQFPDSPRVALLQGIILEGRGEIGEAKKWYEEQLDKDEHQANIRKRLITLHLTSPSTSTALVKGKSSVSTPTSAAGAAGLSKEKGVELLVEYLDTVYNDAEGWSQLASVYAGMGLYAQSLSSLSHLLLLAPHNPTHLLHHAETAYTLGDHELAYKEFLRVVEMCEGVVQGGKEGRGGVGRRAAMGARMCIPHLSSSPSSSTPKLKEMDLLLSKMLLESYEVQGAVGAGVVRRWIGGESASAVY